MKIPSKLKIGGHEVTVICPYKFKEIGNTQGQYDQSMNEIRIDPKDQWSHEDKPESKVAVILLHELLHTCDAMAGYAIFKGDDTEARVENLSEMLFQVLRDNKLRFD